MLTPDWRRGQGLARLGSVVGQFGPSPFSEASSLPRGAVQPGNVGTPRNTLPVRARSFLRLKSGCGQDDAPRKSIAIGCSFRLAKRGRGRTLVESVLDLEEDLIRIDA